MKKTSKRLSLSVATVRRLSEKELESVAGGGSLSTPCTCSPSCLGGCSVGGCPSENTWCASCFSTC